MFLLFSNLLLINYIPGKTTMVNQLKQSGIAHLGRTDTSLTWRGKPLRITVDLRPVVVQPTPVHPIINVPHPMWPKHEGQDDAKAAKKHCVLRVYYGICDYGICELRVEHEGQDDAKAPRQEKHWRSNSKPLWVKCN